MDSLTSIIGITGMRIAGLASCLLGGAVLALCLFLPTTVETVDGVIRPIQVPFAAFPHFMGVFAGIGALLFWLNDEAGAAVMGLVVQILDVIVAFAMGILLFSHIPVVAAAGLVLLWLSLASFRLPRWRLARSVWISGMLSCIWLGYLATYQQPRYGLWLALVGSSMLVVGGALLEREIQRNTLDNMLPWAKLSSRNRS